MEGIPGFPHGPAQGERVGGILGPLGWLLPPVDPKGQLHGPNALQENFPGHRRKGAVASAEITQQVSSPCRNETNSYKATGKNSLNHMLDAGEFVSTFTPNTPFNLHEDPQRWMGYVLLPPTTCIL